MFDRTRPASTAIADGREGLPVPLFVGLIERVLENPGDRMVVFRDHENVAIETPNGLLPTDRLWIPAGHPQVRRHLIEERQRMLAQIDQRHVQVSSRLSLLEDPLRRDIGKPGGTGGSDNDGDFRLRTHGNLVYAGFSG